jgi:glycosyltransferase involved in cell wall biosynthesis
MKVVHLTSVHSPGDPRIFHKQCRALAAAGLNVVLIAPCDENFVQDGVRVRCVTPRTSRSQRLTRTLSSVLRAAWSERADIYHIHDPELIPVGILLRARGVPVIYDVHEDYVTGIRQKKYVPRMFRPVLASAAGMAERLSSSIFETVVAEKYYASRFPRSTRVLNYPILDPATRASNWYAPVPRLVYTGSVSSDRGALTYARILRHLPDFEIHLVGRTGVELRDRLMDEAGPCSDRLVIPFVGSFVQPARIFEYCNERCWLGGLAIFPRTAHYEQKELTKFFEYMACGLPVIASDFPVWRDLIHTNESGIVVPHDDLTAAATAILDLLQRPAAAAGMGRAGRAAVEEHFQWHSQAEALVDLYHSLGITPG